MNILAHGILKLLSDGFSLITILMCLVAKVPQIGTIYRLKSAKGISLKGLYLETLSYTVMMAYNYCSGYSLLSYMEYPVLLLQNYVLLALLLMYKRQLMNRNAAMAAAVYVGVTLLVMRFMPAAVLAMFVPLCTPIGALSKVMVLIEILRTRDSTTVNLTTWFISAFTNLSKFPAIPTVAALYLICQSFFCSTNLHHLH